MWCKQQSCNWSLTTKEKKKKTSPRSNYIMLSGSKPSAVMICKLFLGCDSLLKIIQHMVSMDCRTWGAFLFWDKTSATTYEQKSSFTGGLLNAWVNFLCLRKLGLGRRWLAGCSRPDQYLKINSCHQLSKGNQVLHLHSPNKF